MLGPAGSAETSREFNPIRAFKKTGKPETEEQKALYKASKDFESVMLGMVFKQMRGSGESSDPLNQGQANKMYKDMLADEQAKAMSTNGGIGLADGIYRQLAQQL